MELLNTFNSMIYPAVSYIAEDLNTFVVKQGLDEGDQVVVRGLQQVRPGMPVKTRTLPPSKQG